MGFRLALGLAFALAELALSSPGATADRAPSPVERAHAAILERLDAAKHFLGSEVANDLIVRLDDDLAYEGADAPAGYAPGDWNETAANVIRLDLEFADQVVAGSP